MSDDIKQRLLDESFKGQEAMRREALARIEALEAQLASAEERNRALAAIVHSTEQERDYANDQLATAREALRISLTAMTLASGFEVISIEFECRHAIEAVKAALIL